LGAPVSVLFPAKKLAFTIASTVAFSKDAFPTADVVAGEPSFSLPIQALYSCVGVQAQYQAFVRLAALGSGAAL
jgi:hypothetical protein